LGGLLETLILLRTTFICLLELFDSIFITLVLLKLSIQLFSHLLDGFLSDSVIVVAFFDVDLIESGLLLSQLILVPEVRKGFVLLIFETLLFFLDVLDTAVLLNAY